MTASLDFSSQIQLHDAKAGVPSSSVSVIIDKSRTGAPDYRGLSGWQWEWLRGKILRAGLSPESLPISLLENYVPTYEKIIVGFGEAPLFHFTGKRSVDKWHLSPLPLSDGRIYIPTYDLGRFQKQWEVGLFIEMALARAVEFSRAPYAAPTENFQLNPGIEETIATLERIQHEPELAVDIETGYGQINTVGFAWSGRDAIAINVLPERCVDSTYHALWNAIARVLKSGNRKIFQNFIYDTSYFSAYGIKVEGEIFDTMHAMKVLWPELKSNLGNVGRFYTRRPYWKDDGKVTDEEGIKKDWGNVRDWDKHYAYNCRDTTGTFEASQGQRKDLLSRGLEVFYRSYIGKLIPCAREMCATGMPLDLPRRDALLKETSAKIETLTESFQKSVGSDLNPLSPKQVQEWLKREGVKLPKKYDKATGAYKESADASAIKKIRLKNDLGGLKELQEIKTLRKALSSYIDFIPRPDGRLSYSLNITGTETLRWSGSKDPWDRGFNIQTIPREGSDVSIKSMFLAPEGFSFVEVDLRQAESRFVAYDSADKTLIDMLESGDDVHTHVGNAILLQMGKDPQAVSKDDFKSTWRQLGKKAGHGLNYGMKAGVFVETVFNELDLVISKRDAEQITAAYYGLFPGIPRWHKWIRSELYTKRKLTTPFGWERYFYGRPGDDMFKEGAAFRPQATIPYLTNCLMLHLTDLRREGKLKFNLVDQVHDSLTLLVPDDAIDDVAKVCLDTKAGHPEIDLPGGRMYIPKEVKTAKRLSEAEEWHERLT